MMSRHDVDDVTLLHTAALARGMNSLLIANRVLLLSTETGSQTCFAQGVPPDTTQATSAFTSDQEIIRGLLRDSGIPTPTGRTVALLEAEPDELAARDEIQASLFRAAWGGRQANNSLLAFSARTDTERAVAIGEMRTLAGPRWDRPAQPRGRMFVEEPAGGQHLRSLIIDGRVRAVSQECARPHMAPPVQTLPAALHPEVTELLLRAIQTVSGLKTGTVRISLDDATQALSSQRHAITFVDAYTALDTYPSAADLATELLEIQCRESPLPSARSHVTVDLVSEGHGSREAARDELASYLKSANLDAAVSWQADHGRLEATIDGRPPAVAALCDFLMMGRLDRLRPLWVEARHRPTT